MRVWKHWIARTALGIGALLLTCGAKAQPVEPLHVDQAFSMTAERGQDSGVSLNWAIADGYYLYRDRIELTTVEGASLPIETRKGEPKDDPYFGRLEIYHDDAKAEIAPSVLAGLPADAGLKLTFQGCQDGGICYAPETKTIDLAALSKGPVSFGEAPSPAGTMLGSFGRFLSGTSENSSLDMSEGGGWTFAEEGPGKATGSVPSSQSIIVSNLPERSSGTASEAPASAAVPSSGIVTDASAGGLISGFLDQGGAVFAIGAFFALGLGLAFTPCIFPMYPILAGQLGRMGSHGSGLHGALHSGAYVLSMAAAFGLLGFVAAWSGQSLQIALQSPLAIGLVSALFVALALSMFGAFALRLPVAWTSAIDRAMPGRKGGLSSSAGLGFLSALIVGPCVTAPLAAALLYIAQTGDVMLGAAALFALGLGQGVPLILFGTLGSRVMPKAGAWMTIVTGAFGFAFLAMAIWMASRILEPWVTVGLWGVLALAVAVALGTLAARASINVLAPSIGRLASLVAMVLGGTLLVGSIAGASDPFRPLEPLTGARVFTPNAAPLTFASISSPADLAQRVSDDDRPKLLYFTADWCVSCDVIERDVFENADVRAELDGVDLMKVDVTAPTAEHDLLMKQLSVVGPPTMLFIDRSGTEAGGTRSVGELSAEDFLTRIGAI